MTILLNYYSLGDLAYEKNRLAISAKIRLASYRFGKSEKKMDAYLIKNFKIGLRDLCNKFIDTFSINADREQKELFVFFKDKADDKLASLVTYGNLEIKGSDILKKIFRLFF